jgi:hypothetical protein
MPSSVNVNEMTVVHKTSGGTVQSFPDVCKTPPSAVPLPYPNVAFSADTAQGSSTVTCDGNPVMIKSSSFMTSTGDEAGAGLGVASNIVKGKAQPKLFSMDVKFDGENVMRLNDLMLQNIGSSSPNTLPAPLIQLPIIVIEAEKPKDPEITEVIKLQWNKTEIVCGDPVTLDVQTVNYHGKTLPLEVLRNQKVDDNFIIHDDLRVPIKGDAGSLKWLSVQEKWAKEISIAAHQPIEKATRSNDVKMKTVPDAQETIGPTYRSTPRYKETEVIKGRWVPMPDGSKYGWHYAFDAEIKAGVFTITRRMSFNTYDAVRPGANPTRADVDRWKSEVENVWDKKWKLHRTACARGDDCKCDADNGCCTFNIRIKWKNGSGHGSVHLNAGANDPTGWGGAYWWTCNNWWMQATTGLDEVRAHEFGHLIGMYDEYPAGACEETSPGIRPFSYVEDSIMCSGKTVYERHMNEFKTWFDEKAKGVLGDTKLVMVT